VKSTFNFCGYRKKHKSMADVAPAEVADEAKKVVAKKGKVSKDKKSKDQKLKKGKKGNFKFTINCAAPVDDEIFDIAGFEKFLHDRIKVNGKTGVLGDLIGIERERHNVHVTSKNPMSKRYLKYLAKKFLKKNQLRDYIRVISSSKNTYDLRYFNIHKEEEEEEK